MFKVPFITMLAVAGLVAVAAPVIRDAKAAEAEEVQIHQVIETVEAEKITPDTKGVIYVKAEPKVTVKKFESEKVAAFQEINADVKCIISMENSQINYPVMDSDSDEEYIHTNINGEYSYAGSLFFDHNMKEHPECADIIYGHNMKNGSMFHDIDRLNQDEYWQQDHTITIEWLNSIDKYQPYLAVSGYADGMFRLATNRENIADFVSDKSVNQGSIDDFDYSSDVLILCCCNYSGEDFRTYVFCKKID